METMSSYGASINRPLCEIAGLSTDTKPTEEVEGIRIQNGSKFREIDTGDTYLFDGESKTWNKASSGGGGGGGSATLIDKTITANGTYNASDDGADGYSKVVVDVTPPSNEFYPSMKTQRLMTQNEISSIWEFNNIWSGLTSFAGSKIWTDGDNIYYSTRASYSTYIHYVLNKSTFTWESMYWNNESFQADDDIWTDGSNIYLGIFYVLNKTTLNWESKKWTGLTSFTSATNIWTDGNNIYYSTGSNQYILDKSTSTWNVKTWNGLTNFDGRYIWTNGTGIYYSYGSNHYVLDKSTSTWSTKTWSGLTSFDGNYVWTDGYNIYYSKGSTQYYLSTASSTWSAKTWSRLTSFDCTNIWTDGDSIYYSYDSKQYYLPITRKSFPRTSVKPE